MKRRRSRNPEFSWKKCALLGLGAYAIWRVLKNVDGVGDPPEKIYPSGKGRGTGSFYPTIVTSALPVWHKDYTPPREMTSTEKYVWNYMVPKATDSQKRVDLLLANQSFLMDELAKYPKGATEDDFRKIAKKAPSTLAAQPMAPGGGSYWDTLPSAYLPDPRPEASVAPDEPTYEERLAKEAAQKVGGPTGPVTYTPQELVLMASGLTHEDIMARRAAPEKARAVPGGSIPLPIEFGMYTPPTFKTREQIEKEVFKELERTSRQGLTQPEVDLIKAVQQEQKEPGIIMDGQRMLLYHGQYTPESKIPESALPRAREETKFYMTQEYLKYAPQAEPTKTVESPSFGSVSFASPAAEQKWREFIEGEQQTRTAEEMQLAARTKEEMLKGATAMAPMTYDERKIRQELKDPSISYRRMTELQGQLQEIEKIRQERQFGKPVEMPSARAEGEAKQKMIEASQAMSTANAEVAKELAKSYPGDAKIQAVDESGNITRQGKAIMALENMSNDDRAKYAGALAEKAKLGRELNELSNERVWNGQEVDKLKQKGDDQSRQKIAEYKARNAEIDEQYKKLSDRFERANKTTNTIETVADRMYMAKEAEAQRMAADPTRTEAEAVSEAVKGQAEFAKEYAKALADAKKEAIKELKKHATSVSGDVDFDKLADQMARDRVKKQYDKAATDQARSQFQRAVEQQKAAAAAALPAALEEQRRKDAARVAAATPGAPGMGPVIILKKKADTGSGLGPIGPAITSGFGDVSDFAKFL